MSFVCKNCKKQYINEKSYIKHEINCEKQSKDYTTIDVENLLKRIVKLEKEIKSLKNKEMDIEEWLEEYYSENVEDFHDLTINITIQDLKYMFYNTMYQGIERMIEHHDLNCMKLVNRKMYYYIDGKWKIMPDKELQHFIKQFVKSINEIFDQYVIDEKLLENEDSNYAVYISKLYNTNLIQLTKKAIHTQCKVLYP